MLVAFLVIVTHFLAQIHAKSEAHTICVEHPGEICHVEIDLASHAHDSHLHVATTEAVATAYVDEGSEPAPEPEHEHCPLDPLSSPHGGVVLSDPFVIVLPLLPCRGEFVEIGSTLVPLRAPLTYAPKTSPPTQVA